jgi:predicted nicotinamide N-methyase
MNKDFIGEENMDKIEVKTIVWDENIIPPEEKFDYIVVSDCLFFRKFHKALEHTLSQMLEDGDEEGRVFI